MFLCVRERERKRRGGERERETERERERELCEHAAITGMRRRR